MYVVYYINCKTGELLRVSTPHDSRIAINHMRIDFKEYQRFLLVANFYSHNPLDK